jgi:bacterioferritin-associated ferredoxin
MYVCICNAIRESEFSHACREVDGDVEAVYAALGKRPQCGSCLEEADTMLAEERACDRRLVLVAA